jgi:hypothetical protein
MSLCLKRFTSFEYGQGIGYLEVFVNPAHVAYVQPRRRYDSKTDRHSFDGALLYFQQEAGVLAVREDIGLVVASLTSRGGVCRDCYQELPEAWMSLCAHCREHRHDGIDNDPAQTGGLDKAFAPHKYALEHLVDEARKR